MGFISHEAAHAGTKQQGKVQDNGGEGKMLLPVNGHGDILVTLKCQRIWISVECFKDTKSLACYHLNKLNKLPQWDVK